MMDVASVAMYWMGLYALLDKLLPPPLRQWLDDKLNSLWDWLLHYKPSGLATVTLKVPQLSNGFRTNKFYRQSLTFLTSLESSLSNHNHLEVICDDDDDQHNRTYFRLPLHEILQDTFDGVVVRWQRKRDDGGDGDGEQSRRDEYLTLEFPVAGRPAIIPAYLRHVTQTVLDMELRNTKLYLYSNNESDSWDYLEFNHPSTFDTLALDNDLRRRLIDDLDAFRHNQSLYHQLGRAWKRGYLLYGPPGTGKTSLIAAIANHIHYDVYDLELSRVASNAMLKSLLMNTTRKSVIVIEDIDCAFGGKRAAASGELLESGGGAGGEKGRDTRAGTADAGGPYLGLTLSGLLNFADGLWSGCAEERIFIFTTNFKERLDEALLRPGRMDMHIHLSYCTFSVVQKLAENYLNGASPRTHPEAFAEIEGAMRGGRHTVTPAAVAEIFISHRADYPEVALGAALEAFRRSSSSPPPPPSN